MAITLEKLEATAAHLSIEDVQQFLYREARFLDDRDWDSWLALYAPDVEFWMPSWDDDDQLVTDPPRTTSAMSKSSSRAEASASCGSTGSR